jgi:hypothetical protein
VLAKQVRQIGRCKSNVLLVDHDRQCSPPAKFERILRSTFNYEEKN